MKLSHFLKEVGKPVAYYPELAEFLGSVKESIFLCQFGYWEGKQADKDGWIYKNRDEIREETGLSRSEQETARKRLKAKNYLSECKKGIPRRLYYLFHWNQINKNWDEWLKVRNNKSIASSWRKYNQQVGRASSDNRAKDRPTNSENTSEITSEIPSLQEGENKSFSSNKEDLRILKEKKKELLRKMEIPYKIRTEALMESARKERKARY